ncbi:hypothetical protein LOTGIDRAFT_163527 [Lottia gigantea]|uniref:Peroxidase n=1 Tax=Lottia gigantea TaxID=225164 RepID=V4ACH6_LOTGI|nr:hypothetical protein LOTGIDRAFT_163527 [Lottia gigantea]ESO91011.1 hypothetical protein LOTGIDRAFT_163527 [Lottia gigantea]
MKSTGLGYGMGTQFYYNLSGLVQDNPAPRRFSLHQKQPSFHQEPFFPQGHPFQQQGFGLNQDVHQMPRTPFPHHLFKRQAPVDPEYFNQEAFSKDFLGSKDFPSESGFSQDFGSDFQGGFGDQCSDKPVKCSSTKRYRDYNGLCNNINNPYWGSTMQPLNRMLAPNYMDNANGGDLKCCDGVSLTNRFPLHDHVFKGGPCYPIYIPDGDRHFSRSCMNFVRSQAHAKRQACKQGPREQMNIVTSFLDASAIYSAKDSGANDLRSKQRGRLRTQQYDLLPTDEQNKDCVKDTDVESCFKSGEKRVNEHPGLATLHTMFHREHNRICGWLSRYNPHWGDERVYQEARKISGAMLQHITYSEWLPILLGNNYMSQYGLHVDSAASFDGFGPRNWYYDDKQNPRIINAFAAAAFRIGHTLIPRRFTIGNERIELRKLFNRPKFLYQQEGLGVGMVGEGLVDDALQFPDRFINIELTDHLFEDLNNKSMDLASLNINRGRDHGLPPYNEFRDYCGLAKFTGFNEMKDGNVFASVYRHVDDIDLFSGGIAESSVSDGLAGPTLGCIIATQFRAIKYGDRYWYENPDSTLGFTRNQLREIKRVTMARMMCDDTNVNVMQPKAFIQPSFNNPKVACNQIPAMDFSHWAEVQK